jgi:predicted SAM-dependent methyltransferase
MTLTLGGKTMKRIVEYVKAPLRRTPCYRRLVKQRELRKLRQANLTKINFGCGMNVLAGWVNTDGGDGKYYTPPPVSDIIKLDVWEFLSHVPDSVVSFISSEQFFEHFTRVEGHQLLNQWYRILIPGGILRIQTVDLEKEIQVYLDQCPGVSWEKDVLPHRYRHIRGTPDPYGRLVEGEIYTRSMLLNNGFHMDGHKYLYDFETISQSLAMAGFCNVKRETFGSSVHPEMQGIDCHDGGETGRHWIPKNVLTIEADKSLKGADPNKANAGDGK